MDTTDEQAFGPDDLAADNPLTELDQLRAELEEARDRTLRIQAELENYRKRARRELEDERKYAEIGLLRDLLPVMDNIERAIDAATKKPDANLVLEGIKMVAQQLDGVLEKHDCQRMKPLGQIFDPNLQQAILQQPSADKPEGTVLMVTQAGFQLHDRVVRPAQVIVSKLP